MNFTNKSFAVQVWLMSHPAYGKNAESGGPFEKIMSLGLAFNATAANSLRGCKHRVRVLKSTQWKISNVNTQTRKTPLIKLVTTG